MHNQLPNHYKVLQALFGSISEGQAKEILEAGEIMELHAGSFLFRQGDKQAHFYILLSGRLRVISQDSEQADILGDISEGEPIGEFSLFTDEKRMASVFALRKSILLKLSRENFRDLVSLQPDLSFRMTRYVIDRISQNQFQRQQKAKPQYIAIISMDTNAGISVWMTDLYRQLEIMEEKIHHYGIQDYNTDAPDKLFEAVEQQGGMHFFHCDAVDMDWTRQCLLYCDLVLLITPFNADKAIRDIERECSLYTSGLLRKWIYLVLLHEASVPFPQGTAKWLEERNIDLCLHYRKNHAQDTRRLGRILTRQAVGLVLGGGGGKGYAHVGAVKALLDAGIEIDFIGGSSAGALYGLIMSYIDFDMEMAERLSKESAASKLTRHDYNIPVISILSGRKMKRFLRRVLGNARLEDFWRNSYCVATDYSTASSHVIRSGYAWQQIAASIAIPGIFPPVIIDKHLHLDGGLMDNVPVEPMYSYPVGNIIAVVLSKHVEKELDLEEIPGAWTLLKDRILPGKKKYHIPGISSILMNALILNSHNRLESFKNAISIYLELELKGVGMLDDSKWKELIDKGYAQMKGKLEKIPPEGKFWIKKI